MTRPYFTAGDVAGWLDDAMSGLEGEARAEAIEGFLAHMGGVIWEQLTSARCSQEEREEIRAYLHSIVRNLPVETKHQLDVEIDACYEAAQRARTALDTCNRMGECPSLALWIQTATDGLCDEARARVRVEIEAHYVDARRDHLERGETAIQAHTAAMAGLGSPYDARRDLRRTYLTRSQAKLLNEIGAINWRSCWGVIAWAAIAVLQHAHPLLRSVLFVLDFVLYYAVASCVLPRLRRQKRTRAALATWSLSTVAFSLFYFLLACPEGGWRLIPCFLLPWLAFVLACHAPIWVKMGKSRPKSD
jgi:hypothetical protein